VIAPLLQCQKRKDQKQRPRRPCNREFFKRKRNSEILVSANPLSTMQQIEEGDPSKNDN
jgi:hypothetical protein